MQELASTCFSFTSVLDKFRLLLWYLLLYRLPCFGEGGEVGQDEPSGPFPLLRSWGTMSDSETGQCSGLEEWGPLLIIGVILGSYYRQMKPGGILRPSLAALGTISKKACWPLWIWDILMIPWIGRRILLRGWEASAASIKPAVASTCIAWNVSFFFCAVN